MMQDINDELTMPCAQCCRKHLSAAIAHYADASADDRILACWRVEFARGMINLCEATEGYASHLPFAVGLFVKAEEDCINPEERKTIREFRLGVSDGQWLWGPFDLTDTEWHAAHVLEAEREYPEIIDAVDRNRFYRDNMSGPESRQAEVNYRLAQLRWLDENVFGLKATEKGEEEMACGKKPAKAPKAAAKKAACKGGKCKK